MDVFHFEKLSKSLIYDYFKSKNLEMVLSVMLPSCGMRTGGDTFTEKDIQRYLNLDNEKGTFLRNLYLRRFYGFFVSENLSTRNTVARWTNQVHLQCTAKCVLGQVTLPEPSTYFRYQFAVLQWYLYRRHKFPILDQIIFMQCYRYQYSHFHFIMSVASADKYLDLYLSKSIFNFSI